MTQSQNANGFVCGLSTRKIVHAVADPELEDVAARRPQRDPVLVPRRPELDRVDVLVLLRRVLGVADRAVGPLAEPLGMVPDPRVVGAALEGVVEGDLHAERLGLLAERDEVVERAELGVDGVVAALGRRRSPTGCRGRRAPG